MKLLSLFSPEMRTTHDAFTRLLLVLVLCSLSLTAQATDETAVSIIKTGNGFVRVCSAIEKLDTEQRLTVEEQVNIAVCFGYMRGLLDGVEMMVGANNALHTASLKQPFCPDSGVTLSQTVRIVLKYIKDNPEEAHWFTSLLAATALHKAFPCAGK